MQLNKMKSYYIIASLFSCGIFLACNPCANLDCMANDISPDFRIISRTDGKDLVFGNASVYQKEKIKFYFVKGLDTTVLPWQQKKNSSSPDSVLAVDFLFRPDTVYLQLNVVDVDTITIKYKSHKTRCCGTYYEIERMRLNNVIDELPGSSYPNTIFK